LDFLVTGEDDLGGGKVAKPERVTSLYEIREEAQRLKWKTIVLVGSSIFVCLFFGVVNLSRMVLKPKQREDDLENNAWLALGKEVADVVKGWLKDRKP
jgi:hypothetical protein